MSRVISFTSSVVGAFTRWNRSFPDFFSVNTPSSTLCVFHFVAGSTNR